MKTTPAFFFFFLKFWLHCVFTAFAWVFSGCSKRWPLFVVLLGLLIAVVSLVKHRLQALELQQLRHTGLVALWLVELFRTRDQTHVPCIGRRILIHSGTREVPTTVFLPGKSHGQKSLGGYSPWGHKESDRTQRLNNNNNKEFKKQDKKHSPLGKIMIKL